MHSNNGWQQYSGRYNAEDTEDSTCKHTQYTSLTGTAVNDSCHSCHVINTAYVSNFFFFFHQISEYKPQRLKLSTLSMQLSLNFIQAPNHKKKLKKGELQV